MINLDQLSTEIEVRRGKLGIRQLAREIGISPTTLSRVLHNNKPDWKVINKICDWLNIKEKELVREGKSLAFCPHCGKELPKL